MTVDYKEFRKFVKAVEVEVYEACESCGEGCGRLVQISIEDDLAGMVKVQINWGCCGSVNTDEAMAFANAMNRAISIANRVKAETAEWIIK